MPRLERGILPHLFVTVLAVFLFRYRQTGIERFYGLAATYAAFIALALTIRLSGMTNSVDTALIFDNLGLAIFPFLWTELLVMAAPAKEGQAGFSWNCATLLLALACMAVCSVFDGINLYASFIVPLLEDAFLVGWPLYHVIRRAVPRRRKQAEHMEEAERRRAKALENKRSFAVIRCLIPLLFQIYRIMFVGIASDSSMSYCIGTGLSPYFWDIIVLSMFCIKGYPEGFDVFQPTSEELEFERAASSPDLELEPPPYREPEEHGGEEDVHKPLRAE